MVPLSEIPINSLAWTLGAIATMAVAIRSFVTYKRSYSQLTGFIFWFAFLISIGLFFFGLPSLFTFDISILHATYKIGEVFMYASFIAQGAILWSLMLRQYVSVYAVTIPVALIGFATWLYALNRSVLFLEDNFVGYWEPRICNYLLAALFFALFIPVGLHFIRAMVRQTGFKNRLVPFGLGIVYASTGLFAGIHLIVVRNISALETSWMYMSFYIFLLMVTVWPRREKAKTVLPDTEQST